MQPGKIQKTHEQGTVGQTRDNTTTKWTEHKQDWGLPSQAGVLRVGYYLQDTATVHCSHQMHTKRWIHTHTHTHTHQKWVWNHTREMLPPLRWGMMDYLALRHPVQTTTHWIQNKQNQTKSSHLKMATNKQKRNTKQPLTHTHKHTHAGAALSNSSCLEGGRDRNLT